METVGPKLDASGSAGGGGPLPPLPLAGGLAGGASAGGASSAGCIFTLLNVLASSISLHPQRRQWLSTTGNGIGLIEGVQRGERPRSVQTRLDDARNKVALLLNLRSYAQRPKTNIPKCLILGTRLASP